MSIFRLNSWLEKVDPYYTQRIILHKGLYLATWLTAFNWIGKPDIFTAYCAGPMLLAAFYESQSFTTFAEKDKFLVCSFMICGFGCMTFYLLFPYKFFLLFYAIGFFLVIYYLSSKFFAKLKPFIMTCIVGSALNMSTTPPASLQIAIDMFFCMMLSLIVTFVAFKLYPNQYRKVWHRAFILYVKSVNREITDVINRFETINFATGAAHLNIIRAYRRLLPKQNLINFAKTAIYIRNISFSLTYLLDEEKDETFWFNFQKQLAIFIQALEEKKACPQLSFNTTNNDFDYQYANQNLAKAIRNWNKICTQI
jgi:hypothetical protein